MDRTETEELACRIAAMGPVELIALLQSMQCTFDLDFTEEYLASLPLDRLRHVVLAAVLHRQGAPAPHAG
jgi:hypothetical protein